MKPFAPGEQIILREVWRGRVWSVRPVVSVVDSDELKAVFTPAATPALFPRTSDGLILRIPAEDWVLRQVSAGDNNVLGLHIPGNEHSVLLIWDQAWLLLCWYINMEDDLRRTALGFDYKDHVLDVIVERNLTSWYWKDEDEMAEAVVRGVYTPDEAAEVRAEGERALARLLAREPPYDRRWEHWRPPPEWTAPHIPPGWDRIVE